MAQQHEKALGPLIEELLKVYRLDTKLTEVKAMDCWPKVVGRMIARHTIDLRIDRKILFVRLDSDAIRNELSYAKRLIIKNINKEIGAEAIVDLVLR